VEKIYSDGTFMVSNAKKASIRCWKPVIFLNQMLADGNLDKSYSIRAEEYK